MAETLKVKREMIDGVYHSVHISADGRFRLNTGPDDQRPDHDGMTVFSPICLAEMLSRNDERVWTYHLYCGACRKRIGGLGETRDYCSRCGTRIGHYVFSMGVTNYYKSSENPEIPDELPAGFGAGHLTPPHQS